MKCTLLLIFVTLINLPLFSQTNKQKNTPIPVDSVFVINISEAICKCLKPLLVSMPPSFEKFLVNIVEFGEEKAQKNLGTALSTMSAEEQNKFMDFATKLDSEEMDNLLSGCIEKIDTEFEQMSKKDKGMEDAYKNALLEYLKKSKDCRLTYLIMAMSEKKSK